VVPTRQVFFNACSPLHLIGARNPKKNDEIVFKMKIVAINRSLARHGVYGRAPVEKRQNTKSCSFHRGKKAIKNLEE